MEGDMAPDVVLHLKSHYHYDKEIILPDATDSKHTNLTFIQLLYVYVYTGALC